MSNRAFRRSKAYRQKLAELKKPAHPNSPMGRLHGFIDAFLDLPSSAELEIHAGREQTTGEGAIGIKLPNGTIHPFTLNEVKDLANMLEETGNTVPAMARFFANTVMGVREAVRRIEEKVNA